jgi:hypothetical protein
MGNFPDMSTELLCDQVGAEVHHQASVIAHRFLLA